MARLVAGSRPSGAIIHAKFVEVGQDGEGQCGVQSLSLVTGNSQLPNA